MWIVATTEFFVKLLSTSTFLTIYIICSIDWLHRFNSHDFENLCVNISHSFLLERITADLINNPFVKMQMDGMYGCWDERSKMII